VVDLESERCHRTPTPTRADHPDGPRGRRRSHHGGGPSGDDARDGGAESLKESGLRLLFIDNGFPIPETQIPVFDGGDEPFAFLDMGWRHVQLAVEYDGDQHRTDRPQYVKDARRVPKVAKCGWELIRVINEDRPAEILGRVYEEWLRRGGAEIDKMAPFTPTFAPERRFGRNAGRVA
jgi:hypothetical protein